MTTTHKFPSQPPVRPAQAAHEGPVCGVVLDGAGPVVLPAALPAHVDGPAGVGAERVPDPRLAGPAHPRALRGQPPTR